MNNITVIKEQLEARISDNATHYGSKQIIACFLSCAIIFGAQFLHYLI